MNIEVAQKEDINIYKPLLIKYNCLLPLLLYRLFERRGMYNKHKIAVSETQLLVCSESTYIAYNHRIFCFLISVLIWLILPKIIPVELDRISTCGFSMPRNDFLNLSFVNSSRWFFSIEATFCHIHYFVSRHRLKV